VAKRAVELYLQAFRAAFGFKYVVLRYANVYGPRQDPFGEAGVVAIFARKMLNEQPVTIFGTGKQARDFVYIADVVQANLLALMRGEGGMFNIGTGFSTTINDLYLKLKTASGYRLKPRYAAAVPGEVFEISLDSRNALGELGWQPKTRVDQGLNETLKFFKNATPSARS
jgi:UDP-glucose 4-epimerase